MSVFVLTLFCFLFFVNFGNCNNKHMICKDVDDVFDDSTNLGIPARRLHGPPGKHGMKGIDGIQGLPGVKGEPGNVDYERIEEIVRARVNEETQEMEMRIDELNKQIQNLTKEKDSATAETVTPEIKPCIGVIYEKSCFWKELHTSLDTNFAEASKICTDKNSKLADIYSEEHYNMIMNYIRTGGWVLVWTGMRKQYKNPKAILSDGRTAPFTKPRSFAPGWNTAGSTYTHVYLYMRPDASNKDQGMGAQHPTSFNIHGALCQSL